MNTNLKNEKGFTLTELMMVTFLFPLLTFSVYSVSTSASVLFNTDAVYSELNRDAMQNLRSISREIGQTSPNVSPSHLNITADGNANSIVRFQIPVDWDNDGDVVDTASNPNTEWGAYDHAGENRACQSSTGVSTCTVPTNAGITGRWVRYQVVNNQLIRDVLDATLTVVANSSVTIANNVTVFTAVQNLNTLTLNMTLRRADNIGQRGTARNFQMTFTTSTILRNAVN